MHFATYQAYYKGPYDNNIPKNIEYKTELGEWIFTYFGYNYDTKRVFAYARFANRIDTLEWENVHHFRPSFAKFYLGGDKYHWSFSGTLRNFNAVIGKGAY